MISAKCYILSTRRNATRSCLPPPESYPNYTGLRNFVNNKLRIYVSMSTLGERIRLLRGEVLKLTQAEFADRLGFRRVATISDYEKNKRAPDIETLRRMAGLGGVNIAWLLTGDGPVTLYDNQTHAVAAQGRGEPYSGSFGDVKVYDISSAGGPGNFPGTDPIDIIKVPLRDSKKTPVALRVKGDGMNPTIFDGAIAGVDTGDRRLVSGKLYVIWLRYEGVTIKRVFVQPDKIVLKNDNPTFPVTSIPKYNLGEDFIIGRVAWVYQRC